jgi:hypothetical protein
LVSGLNQGFSGKDKVMCLQAGFISAKGFAAITRGAYYHVSGKHQSQKNHASSLVAANCHTFRKGHLPLQTL